MRKFRWNNIHNLDKLSEQIKELDLSLLNDKIVFGMAIDKTEGIKPGFFIVKFIPKDESVPEDVEYDYGDYLIVRKAISLDFFEKLIEKVKNNQELDVKPIENCVLKIDSWDGKFIPSKKPWGLIHPEFPTLYYAGRLNNQTSGRILQDYLIGNGNPPYPTVDKALTHLFDLRITFNFTQTEFLIIIPDLRARIKRIVVSDKTIKIETENKGFNVDELIIQSYISGNGLTETESYLEIKNGMTELAFKKEPEEIMILLCTKSGVIIDQKEISMKYKQPDSTVVVETPAYSLLEIIKSGESSHVEFKSKLDNPEPFVSSVISFANSDGGRIFIGVDDYGEIIGLKKFEDVISKISNWIGQYCDPRIEVNSYFSNELGIVVVEVPIGDKKPYFLKTGGCFIRHGATDRQVTRVELENMQTKDNGRSGISF